MNFNGLLIGTENPQRLKDYYTKLFGKPNWDDGGYTGWLIGSGSMTVGPHDQVKRKNAAPGRLIWNIEAADVKAEFAKLKAAGATVVKEPYQMGESPGQDMWITTFADPDDNYFQLMSPMEMPTKAARPVAAMGARSSSSPVGPALRRSSADATTSISAISSRAGPINIRTGYVR